MEIKRSRSSKPPIEVAQGADVAELIEIDTALAVHSSELPAKVSDLIEQHKQLAATDPDEVTLVEVLEHDKTHTEVTNHFAIVSKLDVNRTANTAALESRSKQAKTSFRSFQYGVACSRAMTTR